MPPKSQPQQSTQPDRRRQRQEHNSKLENESSNEFCDLPTVSQARFTSLKQHTIVVPLDVPATQLGPQATFNLIAAKVLFQPAKNFGIDDDDDDIDTKENKHTNPTKDAVDTEDLFPGLRRTTGTQNPFSSSTAVGRSNTPVNFLPRRIICSVNNVVEVKPLGTKSPSARGDLLKLAVTVSVQSVKVLSDGFCSAMVCRSQQAQQRKANNNDDGTTGDPATANSIERNTSLGLKLSFFLVSKTKTKKNNDHPQQEESAKEHDDDEGTDKAATKKTPATDEFFQATVFVDAPHILTYAPENKFGGKKVLVSIENNGTAWRAHFGVTPFNGSGGKNQSGGHWEVHMPWSKKEVKAAWNFRAPPPSQRSSDDRVVVKFVRDSLVKTLK